MWGNHKERKEHKENRHFVPVVFFVVAYSAALDATYDFVHDSDRRPRKWDELSPHLPTYLLLHERLANVGSHVYVNFATPLTQVASRDVERFDAIRPIGPSYGKEEPRISSLLELTKFVIEKKTIPSRTKMKKK